MQWSKPYKTNPVANKEPAMKHRLALPLSALALVTAALLPAEALAAGPEACGGIDFWNVSECHFEFEGACRSQCEPVSFVGACSGQCEANVEAYCNAECTGSCLTECQVDPGHFDCHASCTADCEARAYASCGGDSECLATAEGHCEVECGAQCEYVPPSASCETKCEASCHGSCEVDANVDCYVECSVELQGGCEVDCDTPSGALFCDGQYIPVEDLPECLDYLLNNFDLDVEAEAEGHASFNLGCSTAGGRSAAGGLAAWLLVLGLVAWRRRRP